MSHRAAHRSKLLVAAYVLGGCDRWRTELVPTLDAAGGLGQRAVFGSSAEITGRVTIAVGPAGQRFVGERRVSAL